MNIQLLKRLYSIYSPSGKPATPWASCLSKPAARHRPRLPNSTTTPPRPHSKVRSTISQRAAAITMPSSPTRRSPAPRPTSRSGTCVRRRATISTAPKERTGFCDGKYFREVFKKYFNVSPSQYAKGDTPRSPKGGVFQRKVTK